MRQQHGGRFGRLRVRDVRSPMGVRGKAPSTATTPAVILVNSRTFGHPRHRPCSALPDTTPKSGYEFATEKRLSVEGDVSYIAPRAAVDFWASSVAVCKPKNGCVSATADIIALTGAPIGIAKKAPIFGCEILTVFRLENHNRFPALGAVDPWFFAAGCV